jgi:hypothetical protein
MVKSEETLPICHVHKNKIISITDGYYIYMETTYQRHPDIAMFYTPVLQCMRTRGRIVKLCPILSDSRVVLYLI